MTCSIRTILSERAAYLHIQHIHTASCPGLHTTHSTQRPTTACNEWGAGLYTNRLEISANLPHKKEVHVGRHLKSLSEVLTNLGSTTYFGRVNDDTAYTVLSSTVQHALRCNILQSVKLPLDCHVVGQFTNEPIEAICMYSINLIRGLSADLCTIQRYIDMHTWLVYGRHTSTNVSPLR